MTIRDLEDRVEKLEGEEEAITKYTLAEAWREALSGDVDVDGEVTDEELEEFRGAFRDD